MALRTFKLFRGDSSGGELLEYKIEVEKGMVVLDAIHRIQTEQANDLAVRWNKRKIYTGVTRISINFCTSC